MKIVEWIRQIVEAYHGFIFFVVTVGGLLLYMSLRWRKYKKKIKEKHEAVEKLLEERKKYKL